MPVPSPFRPRSSWAQEFHQAQALAWTAFAAFNRGAFLIYAGQESGATHTPSLFDVDKVAWGDYPLQPFLTRLAQLKKDPAQMEGEYVLLQADPAIQAAWIHPEGKLFGLFNTQASTGKVPVCLPDGVYADVPNEIDAEVQQGRTPIPESAAILRTTSEIDGNLLFSILLDYKRVIR